MRRLVLLFLLLLAAPAQAQEITGTVEPQAVVHGEHERVTWRIRILTGETAVQHARLTVDVATEPGFFRPLWIDADEVRLQGDGQLHPGPVVIIDPCWAPGPTYGLRTRHGVFGAPTSFFVDLPAHSEATVVVPAHLSRDAPWPGMTYGLVASLDERPFDLPKATIGGRSGVPLSIDVPGTTTGLCTPAGPANPAGFVVRLSGRADAGIAGDRIDVFLGGPRAGEPARAVGSSVVGADGSFAYESAPLTEPGSYAVAAWYASQRPDRTDDFSHPRMFTVDPPPPPPPPPLGTVAIPGRVRVVAGNVRVPLACSGAGRCTGVLRLKRAGRRVAARRYDLAPAARATLRLRLPAAARRTLRRRGRVTVGIETAASGGPAASQRVTLRR